MACSVSTPYLDWIVRTIVLYLLHVHVCVFIVQPRYVCPLCMYRIELERGTFSFVVIAVVVLLPLTTCMYMSVGEVYPCPTYPMHGILYMVSTEALTPYIHTWADLCM